MSERENRWIWVSLSTKAATWEASSAVGTMIRTWGLFDNGLPSPSSSSSLRRWIIGIRYANVFPDPLWSAMTQLFPSITGVNAMACHYPNAENREVIPDNMITSLRCDVRSLALIIESTVNK